MLVEQSLPHEGPLCFIFFRLCSLPTVLAAKLLIGQPKQWVILDASKEIRLNKITRIHNLYATHATYLE